MFHVRRLRQFEERLVHASIPYRVYGGLRFFERAEIKNALAYLRLIANRDDDVSFQRIVNTPTRGIGAKTIDDIRIIARDRGTSLWHAAVFMIEHGMLSARAGNALAGFLQLIDRLSDETEGMQLFEQVKRVVEKSGLIEFYENSKAEQGEEKVENLEELVNAARLFDPEIGNEDNLGPLEQACVSFCAARFFLPYHLGLVIPVAYLGSEVVCRLMSVRSSPPCTLTTCWLEAVKLGPGVGFYPWPLSLTTSLTVIRPGSCYQRRDSDPHSGCGFRSPD